MKWKCSTSQLLSVPVAAAVMGFGTAVVGQVDTAQPGVGAPTAVQDQTRLSRPATESGPVHAIGGFSVGEGRGWRAIGHDGASSNDTNCGQMVTQNNDPKTVVFPNVPVCNGAETVETWIARSWAAGELSSICAFKFGIGEIQGNQADTQIDVLIKQGGAAGSNPANMPVLCSATVNIPGSGSNGQFFTVKFDPTCNPDPSQPVTIALRVAAPVGSGTFVFPAGNNLGESAPTYIASAGCGIASYVTMASIGFADAMVLMQVFDGEGEPTPGACCLPKENGDDADPICIDGILGGECADLGGVFHVGQECENEGLPSDPDAKFTCPRQVECKPFPKDDDDDDDCPDCTGDLNDDGVVNVDDLLILFDCWGPVTNPDCECADLANDDNVVNVDDLLVMFDNWGDCPTAIDGGDTTDEGEECGTRVNDGCNQDPPQFGSIACGETICGTGWTGVELADPPQGHEPGTCEGSCGGQAPSGCWCDDKCFGFGDCCIDICDWCSPPDVPECVSGEVNVRDTDWYLLDVDTKTRVTWKVHAEFPATAIIAWMGDGDCDEVIIVESATSPAKVPFQIEACLQPGKQYVLFIAPSVFEGLPCDGPAQWGHNYTVQANCSQNPDHVENCPKGACCFIDGSCEELDEVKCFIEGGSYEGDGTSCDDNLCAVDGACCFNDGECIVMSLDACINDQLGAFRGIGTSCGPDTCRDCATDAGVQFNPADLCDEDLSTDPYNGGCNYFPGAADNDENPAFEQACCGDSWIGEIWAIPGQGRDLDWRVIEIKKESSILLTLEHDFNIDGIVFFASAGCPASIISSAAGPSPVHLNRSQVAPGTYYVIVSSAFATGPGMECGSGNNAYQLDITCKNFDGDLCLDNCGNDFVDNETFPDGFCSCDPDFCGAFGNCCPGICDHCFGVVCDVAECQYDPNSTNNAFTWAARGNVIWAQGYPETCPDNGIINEIASSFGSAMFPGTSGLTGGEEVRWYIFASDPADGGPGALLMSGVGAVSPAAIESDEPQSFPVPGGFDVTGLGTFYVAVHVWTDPSCTTCFVAPADNTAYDPAEHDGLIWLLGGAGDADIDDFDPNNPVQRLNILDHVWMLRVND